MWLFWTLPLLLQRWCSTCLLCVHTLTPRENRERSESGNILKSSKNTICNEHPVSSTQWEVYSRWLAILWTTRTAAQYWRGRGVEIQKILRKKNLQFFLNTLYVLILLFRVFRHGINYLNIEVSRFTFITASLKLLAHLVYF